jgi:hypothetical protein
MGWNGSLRNRTCLAVLAIQIVLMTTGPGAEPVLTQVSTPAFGGTIKQIRRVGDTIYLAGSFVGASPRDQARGGLSIHDGVSSLRSVETPYVRGTVHAIIPDSSGGYYIGGNFHAVGSAVRQGVARILTDGSVDPVFAASLLDIPGLGGQIWALAKAGNTLFVGGSFRPVSGPPQDRSGLVALDATTGATLPLAFDLRYGGRPSGPVRTLAIEGNRLYVAGTFDSVGEQRRSGLAAFDVGTGALSPWNPSGAGGTFAIAGGTMYAPGTSQLQAIDLTSGMVRPFGPRFVGDTGVSCLRPVGGALVIGGLIGGFLSGEVVRRENLAAIDLATGALLPWAPTVSEPVDALAVAGSTLYVGGGFIRVNGVERGGTAAFDWTTGGTLLPWNPSMNGEVLAMVVDGPRVLLGGEFTGPFAQARRSVAAIDARTGQLTPWQIDTNGGMFLPGGVRGPVDAMAIADGRMFLGGDARDYPGGDRGNYLVPFDLATGARLSWAVHPEAAVTTIEARDGAVYATGSLFLGTEPASRQTFAAFDVSGNLLPVVADSGPIGRISTLAVSDTRLFLGGFFQSLNGVPRQGLAALDRGTGAVGPLNLPAVAGVSALALDGNTLYMLMPQIVSATGETSRQLLAAVDAASGSLTSWNPGAGWSKPVQPTQIAAHGGQVLASGWVVIPPVGVAAGVVTAISATGVVSETNLAELFGGSIDALFFDGQVLAVGGAFGFVGADLSPTPGLALFQATAGLATPR